MRQRQSYEQTAQRSRAPSATALAVCVLAAGCGVERDPPQEPVDALGFAVKTVCPSSKTLTPGIDVSRWQGSIDWAGVKRSGKVKFAIARATHGLTIIDSYFARNWKGIKARGLVRGVYQYFDPGEDPVKQADLMLSKVSGAGGLAAGDLPPVLDIESSGGMSASVIQKRALAWLQRVQKKTGKRPIVYSAAYFAQKYLGSALKAYPLWIANYKYTTSGACPLLPNSAWSRWKMWQYSDKGSISGIHGAVDLDVFDGTLTELEQFIAANSGNNHPTLEIDASIRTISGQKRDSCDRKGSDGIFDWREGQHTKVYVEIENKGPAVARNLKIGLWAEQPYVQVRRWAIYSDYSGSFELNDTDKMQKVSRTDPGKQFDLWLGSLSKGETKRIVLDVEARRASIGSVDHPDVRAWVKHVDSWYDKSTFASKPTNVGGKQKQNGGDLRAWVQTDVLGSERCDGRDNDCDGDVDEGSVCGDGGPRGGDGWKTGSDAGPGGWVRAGDGGASIVSGGDGCALAPDGELPGLWLPCLWLLGLIVRSRRRTG